MKTALLTSDVSLIDRLPKVRGRIRAQAEMSKFCWFQAGGTAEAMFKPEDAQDLAEFLAGTPSDIPITVIGVGSNLLVRDGGLEGVVIRLGREFIEAKAAGDMIVAGAGGLSYNAAMVAQQGGIAGLEFLTGIPGSIGGALAMNGGAYGGETADILIDADIVDRQGKIHTLSKSELKYSYRHCDGLPEGGIFIRARFQGKPGDADTIAREIKKISENRAATQPIRAKTGGSTFKNPNGHKAWELIEKAGCRGLKVGDAQMSQKHCNFMINTGAASAKDLETLGEEVRKRVLEKNGIMLEWEIKRVGKP